MSRANLVFAWLWPYFLAVSATFPTRKSVFHIVAYLWYRPSDLASNKRQFGLEHPAWEGNGHARNRYVWWKRTDREPAPFRSRLLSFQMPNVNLLDQKHSFTLQVRRINHHVFVLFIYFYSWYRFCPLETPFDFYLSPLFYQEVLSIQPIDLSRQWGCQPESYYLRILTF